MSLHKGLQYIRIGLHVGQIDKILFSIIDFSFMLGKFKVNMFWTVEQDICMNIILKQYNVIQYLETIFVSHKCTSVNCCKLWYCRLICKPTIPQFAINYTCALMGNKKLFQDPHSLIPSSLLTYTQKAVLADHSRSWY